MTKRYEVLSGVPWVGCLHHLCFLPVSKHQESLYCLTKQVHNNKLSKKRPIEVIAIPSLHSAIISEITLVHGAVRCILRAGVLGTEMTATAWLMTCPIRSVYILSSLVVQVPLK